MLKKLTQYTSILLIASAIAIAAEESNETKINYIELATTMFYDGKYQKAHEQLQKAKESNTNIEWDKYHTLKGLMFTKDEHHGGAIESFRAAIEATRKKVYVAPVEEKPKKEFLFSLYSQPKKPKIVVSSTPPFEPEKLRRDQIEELYIYLSNAYYKNGQYVAAVQALDSAGSKGNNSASLYTLRAECYWKADQKSNAIEALNRGSRLFPNDTTLLKQKFYYFAELKLYKASIDAAKRYIKQTNANEQEYISLAQMLMGANEKEDAIRVLEEAKVVFPTSSKIYILLGHLYKQKDMEHITADFFEKASYYDTKFLKEAAEMYRRIGNLSHALYLNSKMSDNLEKTKQQVAIYVSRGEYDKIIGLKDAMGRYGLLEDDTIKYALAYAYYIVKEYDTAEIYLKQINDDELFSKATVIRKNIEKCKNDSMECI